MAKGKNCPNCAAPYDPALNKCPYCGTIYFDLSCLDFTAHEPIYLKMKIPMRQSDGAEHGMVITQLCIPEIGEASINMESEHTYYTNCYTSYHTSIRNNTTLTTNLTFRAIPDKSGALCYVEAVE